MKPRDLSNLPCPHCGAKALYGEQGSTKYDRGTWYTRCLVCSYEVARVAGRIQTPLPKARVPA